MSIKTKLILAPTVLTEPNDTLTAAGQVACLDASIEAWIKDNPNAGIISISHQQSTGVIHRDATIVNEPKIETRHYFSALIVYRSYQETKKKAGQLLLKMCEILTHFMPETEAEEFTRQYQDLYDIQTFIPPAGRGLGKPYKAEDDIEENTEEPPDQADAQ